jgi:hypothetical protein
MTSEATIVPGTQTWADAHPMPFGTKAPSFRLLEPATDRWWNSDGLDRKDIYVVSFICNHCPHSSGWEGRLLQIARDFAGSVSTVFISSSNPLRFPDDGPKQIAERSRTHQFPAPYLIDPDQKAADAFAAVRTPHVFVFRRGQGLVYRGAIDDNEEDPKAITKHYLRDALTEAVAGRAVTTRETPLQGCGIKRDQDAGPRPTA